ncbi:MAG: hypothetical protein H7A32_01105 [Deltaproteobacteria bacterium]|nr:hypothetical protein [Deltaproteobacteria bacterium]
MKQLFSTCFLSVLLCSAFAISVHAIGIRNYDTHYSDQGVCVVGFEIWSEGENVKDLKIDVNLLDADGKKLQSGILKVKQLDDHGVMRTGNAKLEIKNKCLKDLIVEVVKATAKDSEGKEVLLKVNPQDFNPCKIKVKETPKPNS